MGSTNKCNSSNIVVATWEYYCGNIEYNMGILWQHRILWQHGVQHGNTVATWSTTVVATWEYYHCPKVSADCCKKLLPGQGTETRQSLKYQNVRIPISSTESSQKILQQSSESVLSYTNSTFFNKNLAPFLQKRASISQT